MQLVQDGGLARRIQPKHHDLKITETETVKRNPNKNKSK
jgi:hypothetical protein